MATGYNLADGLAEGTVPATGNTGGASGDPIQSVAISAGDSIVATSAAASTGARGYRVSVAAAGSGATRLMWAMVSPTRLVMSVAFRIDTLPTATEDVMGLRHGSGNMGVLQIGADGKLIMANAAGAGITASKSTAAITAGTWYQVDMCAAPGADTVTGTLGYAYYPLGSSTPTFSWESAAVNAGTTAVATGFVGRSTGRTQAHVLDYDTIRWNTQSSGFLAPYVATTAVANAGPDQGRVEPYTTVTLDGSASVGATTYTWTQTAGTAVTLSGTGPTRTFKAPGSLNGETLRFRLTVDDGSVDDVDVVTLPSDVRMAVGAALVAVEMRMA